MNEAGNPGLTPRNKANKALYRSASAPVDPELVSWAILTAIDPRLWPARPVTTLPAPANDVDAPVVIDGGTVTRIDLPERSTPYGDPEDAA